MEYFDLETPKEKLQSFLLQKNWINASEYISEIVKPGEGNMNVVLRIKTNEQSFILKQSRPFVQKYQQVNAPLNRIDVEHQFYSYAKSEETQAYFPTIINYDKDNHLIMMEDLGEVEDLTSIYQSREIEDITIAKLVHFLKYIHSKKVPNDYPANLELRQLNHQHIFVLPFLKDNGFDLDSVQKGLQNLSLPIKNDAKIKAIADDLGQKYLASGNTLLHGDFYPGSWMQQGDNLYVIDPEFSFAGDPHFDLGVMVAHLIIATLDEKYIDTVVEHYDGANKKEIMKIAATEIMRRLIGLAQLPLNHSLEEKDYLLKLAHRMMFV